MVSAKKYKQGDNNKKMVCRVCLKNHPLRFCERFSMADYDERMKLVTIYKYCAGCLSHDHTWRTCVSTGKCKRCGDMHHTLLHKPDSRPRSSGPKKVTKPKRRNRNRKSLARTDNKGPRSSRNAARGPRSSNGRESRRPSPSKALVPSRSRNLKPQQSREVSRSTTCEVVPSTSYRLTDSVLLKPTAIINIVAHGRYHTERAVIDPTAERTLISEKVVRRLGVKTVKVGRSERVLLIVRGNYGSSDTVETYAEVRCKLDGLTPSRSVDGRIANEFPGLQLADPTFFIAAPIGIRFGCDVYSKIIRNGVFGGTMGKPLAQFSIFGYLISGLCSL